MAAVLPGGRTPMGLVDVLDEFECVIDSKAHLESDDDVEHDGPWIEVMIDGPTVPSDICTEAGRSGYGVSSAVCQGYDNCVAELVPDSDSGGER